MRADKLDVNISHAWFSHSHASVPSGGEQEFSDCTGECKKSAADTAGATLSRGREKARGAGVQDISFDKWMEAGWDKGSKVGKWPAPPEIMAMARKLLLMPPPPPTSDEE